MECMYFFVASNKVAACREDDFSISQDLLTTMNINAMEMQDLMVRHLTMSCCTFFCRGKWHGDVAIKELNLDSDSDCNAQLQAFKLEVSDCFMTHIA
jgi:hypothetical protein